VNERILIVEDERAILLALSSLLRKEGYAVSIANDGPQALHMVGEESYDLVLSDLSLGDGPSGMDVVQASNRFHRIDPATVKAEVEAAGFKFDGESKVLADAADDHTKMVLDPAILGKTDQFLLRFRKPK